MSLPRPLLVLLIVVLLLGVAGCALSLARADEEGQNGTAELRDGRLSELLARFAPPSERVELTAAETACLNGQGNLQFNDGCLVSIAATDDLRRTLELEVAAGSVEMVVVATTRGEAVTSSPQPVPFDGERSVSVVLARGDSATVSLDCLLLSCLVLVNP